MIALKYAKQIVKEVTNYQKIKNSLLRLHGRIKYYDGLKSKTRDHRKKAAISAHVTKLHKKAAVIKKQAEIGRHKIHTLTRGMYRAL